MDTISTEPNFEINHRIGGGGRGWAAHYWYNRKRPWLPCSAQNKICFFFYHLPSILWISCTNSISNQIKGIYYSHTIALYRKTKWHLTFCKILYQKLGASRPVSEQLQSLRKEGNVLFDNALNTFYLRSYGFRAMVNDHSDNAKGNPLPPHGLLFSISFKVYFICTHKQDNTYHDLC